MTRAQARRVAVRAQLLDLPRPTDVLDVVRALGHLQVDLTAAVAPSAELVLWSRLGTDGMDERTLEDVVGDGSLVEIGGMLRPVEDVALYRAEMAAWRDGVPLEPWQAGPQRWIAANDAARHDVLELLRAEGPLPAQAIPDTTAVPWRSTGWTNGKNVMKLLEIMAARGEVAVASREGRERNWDLSSRVWADDPERAPDLETARAERDRRALAALGLRRTTAKHPAPVGAVAVAIDGVAGTWCVDPERWEQRDTSFRGRCAVLSPLDRLVFDRRRLLELFEFEYQLEMYKPAAQRRWGYWAMPVLVGDRMLARVDATAEPDRGVLRLDAVHGDDAFDDDAEQSTLRELDDLARYLGLVLDDAR